MAEMCELAMLFLKFQSICGIQKTIEDMFIRPHPFDLIEAIQLLTTNENKQKEKHGQKLFNSMEDFNERQNSSISKRHISTNLVRSIQNQDKQARRPT